MVLEIVSCSIRDLDSSSKCHLTLVQLTQAMSHSMPISTCITLFGLGLSEVIAGDKDLRYS
jgi:hypothetical protein